MPELPDVATFRHRFDATARGHRVEHTTVTDTRILEDVSRQQLAQRLHGRRLDGARRHGKYLFVRAGDAVWLVLHFGMTGELLYDEDSDYARLVLDLDHDHRLLYTSRRMLGRVGFTDDVDAFVADHGLGPDAASDDLDAEAFVSRIGGRSGMIKSTLMDQSLVAGLGNVYSDEILFQAGVHPRRRTDTLDTDELRALYRVMRRVLRVTTDHHADPGTFPRGYLTPRREDGAACPRCDDRIETCTVSGRTSYVCPQCQPAP